MLNNAHFIFFQNLYDQSEIINKNINLKNKSKVIPGSGINLTKFNFIGINIKQKNFIFIGRIIRDKGIMNF